MQEKGMVAAGAVVRPNFVVPSGKLVAGVPAKVIRDLTDDEIAEFDISAERYVQYTKTTIESLERMNNGEF